MEYRNIKRAFVFNRAAKRLIRSQGAALHYSDLFILFCVSEGYNSILTVFDQLVKHDRKHSTKQISDKLKKLHDLGLIERAGVKWRLSLSGRNALNSLEQLVRDCRTDK